MFGERLLRARSAAGLSMKQLAEKAGVSANMIKKYEHNQSVPGSAVLVKMSRALNVRNEYFFRPTQVELKNIEYRKRQTVSAKMLAQIHADVIDQAERWLELANLWPNFPVPHFSQPDLPAERIQSYEQIEHIADCVRQQWGLGHQPITHLIDVLESHGILVIVTDVAHSEKFDGCQAMVDAIPVIVISAKWPGDRQRFTLAHELGHLILHQCLSPHLDEEKACNRFAGALLFPSCAVLQHFGTRRSRLEDQELYLQKMDYGLSMMACIYRAADLTVITEAKRKEMIMQFSVRKWRKQEPGEQVARESTTLFPQLIFRALGEGIISEGKAAELMGMSLVSFHRERKLGWSDDHSHQ